MVDVEQNPVLPREEVLPKQREKEEPSQIPPPAPVPEAAIAAAPVPEAKDPAPEATKVDSGVPITFDAGGSSQIVLVTAKPLGMIFSKVAPITVMSLRQGSHAEQLGVQAGWVMKKVGTEDVSGMTVEAAADIVQRACKDLPQAENSVVIVFDENGTEQTVIASRTPFGATLMKQAPLTISRVTAGSHADKLRVKPGWTVKSIRGQDVSKMEYDAAMAVFETAVKSLTPVET